MEGFHSNSKMAKMFTGNLENVDINSPLFRYLCAQSQSPSPTDALKPRRRYHSPLPPLSPLENLRERSSPSKVYRTPIRAVQREEVLVIDGILVTGGGRSSRSASDISSSSSSDSSGKALYKTDICRSREDFGSCNCQFAHGKENWRPNHFPVKNKSEAQMCKLYTGTGPCTPSPKSRFAPQVMESSATGATVATKQEASLIGHKSTITTPTTTIKPYFSTGTPPSRDDIDTYITNVLYGPTTRRRLQVFTEICPE